MRKISLADRKNKCGKAVLAGILCGIVLVASACGMGSGTENQLTGDSAAYTENNESDDVPAISEDKKRIVDNYAEIMMLQDQDSASYDRMMDAVSEYIEEPTPEKKQQTIELLDEMMGDMAALADSYERCQLDDDFAKLLEENGIMSAEYEMNADGRYQILGEYVYDMYVLKYAMEEADYDEDAMAELIKTYDRFLEVQKNWRAYYYTSVNYWFAGWDEEDVDYIKQNVLDKFQSLNAETPTWETDRDAVELRMETYFSVIEDILNDIAEEIGEEIEQLYELEKEIGELQEQNGQ